MQGLAAPIANSSLLVLFIVAIAKTLLALKGDGAVENKIKIFVNMNLDILYTMSANLAGGALLAKALQIKRSIA